MFTAIYYWFKVITSPSCWIQNERYSETWDAELTRLMKIEKFQFISKYTARIDNITIWIGNHPYASFTTDNTIAVRPSRKTIYRAKDKLEKDLIVK